MLTPLLGREGELARVGQLLSSGARLVTLLGPPGIGKTRLAAELHRDHGERSGWADLSTTERRGELCARVASAFELRLSWLGTGELLDELAYAIDGHGATLLVLDEADGCIDALREALPRWLRTAEGLTVLSTSRERLGESGEHVVELSPLDADASTLEGPAAQLLVTRGGIELDAMSPTDRETLGRLLARLDGIPFAIELVAARLRVMSPEEILTRFDSGGLRAIEESRRGQRHGLEAALEASWQRLDPEERRAFSLCSVFVGTFDTDAAEAVIGDGAVDLLHRLRDLSLLARSGQRHRMYSPVRAFAGARLADGAPRDRAELAHARFYAARARHLLGSLRGPSAPHTLRALVADLDQLLAAHARVVDVDDRVALATAAGEVFLTRGPAQEALRLASGDAPALAMIRARALESHGRIDEALRELAPLADASSTRAEALSRIAFLELARGRLERAAEVVARALSVAPLDDASRVDALRCRALIEHASGALNEARADYDAARRAADELGLSHRSAQLRVDLGAVRMQEGRLDEAREHYAAATVALDPSVDPVPLGLAEGNLAILAQELGDLDQAEALYARGIERLRKIGHRLYVAHLKMYSGALAHERGDVERAALRYEDALDALRAVGDARFIALTAALRGAAEAERGRIDAAREAFALADDALTKVPDPGIERAVALHRHHLRLAEAATTARSDAVAAIAEAGSDPSVLASDDARLALRLLRRGVRLGVMRLDPARARVTLADGTQVELANRAVLWRLVEALANARRGGAGLDPHALLAAGWPGESPSAESGLNRVKVALSTLRKLGLRDAIVRAGDGYRFDPSIPIEWEPEPDA